MHNSFVIAAEQDSPRSTVARLQTWVKDAAAFLAVAFSIHQQRQELQGLDDRMLADIGLTRQDVQRESARGFWDLR